MEIKKAEIQISTNADEAKAKIDGLSNSTEKLGNSNRNNKQSIVDSNSAMNIANTLTGGLAGNIRGAAESSGLMATAQKALSIATATGTSAMKVFQIALASTGIGLIIVAVGLLINYFKDFDPVVDKIEQGMAAFGAVIRVVQQALASLFSSTEDSSEAFGNLGDKMAEAAKEAAELKAAQQDLEDVMKLQDISNAKASQRYDELIVKSKNRTLTEKERIAILQEADAIETANFKERSTLAEKDLDIAQRAAKIKGALNDEELANLKKKGTAYALYLQSLGKITEDEVDAIKKAELAKIDIQKENTSRNEKSQNRQNALAEKAESDAQAIRDKANEKRKAAEDKAKADKEKHDADYKSYTIKQLRELEDLQDDSEEKKFARKKARELEEIKALAGKNDAEYKILKDGYDKKYALLEQDIENRKNREESERLDKNKKDKEVQAEKDANDLKTLLDANVVKKAIADAKTEEEVRDLALKNQILLDTQERAEITKAIMLGASSEQLQIIRDNYDAKEVANTQSKADAIRKIDDAQRQHKAEVADKLAGIASNLNGLLQAAGVKNKAILKAGIIAEKATAIGSIIMNTMVANAKATAAMPLTGGMPFVALNYVGMGLGIAATIASTIKALSELGGGGAGGGDASAGGASSPARPSVNFQNTPQAQISDTIQSSTQERNSQPIKAYVVAGDVSTAQSLDRNIIEGAKF